MCEGLVLREQLITTQWLKAERYSRQNGGYQTQLSYTATRYTAYLEAGQDSTNYPARGVRRRGSGTDNRVAL